MLDTCQVKSSGRSSKVLQAPPNFSDSGLLSGREMQHRNRVQYTCERNNCSSPRFNAIPVQQYSVQPERGNALTIRSKRHTSAPRFASSEIKYCPSAVYLIVS